MKTPKTGQAPSSLVMSDAYEKVANRIAHKPVGYLPLTPYFASRQAFDAGEITREAYEQIVCETDAQLRPHTTYLGWLQQHYDVPAELRDGRGFLSLVHSDREVRGITRARVKGATVAWMRHNAEQYRQKYREQVATKASEEATK